MRLLEIQVLILLDILTLGSVIVKHSSSYIVSHFIGDLIMFDTRSEFVSYTV